MKILRDASRIVSLFFAAGLAAACVTVTDSGAKVRLAKSADDVRDCKLLGHLTAKSGWGNPAAAEAGRRNVDSSLRNQTADLGGDTLVIARVDVGEGTTSGEGDAYRCAPTKP